MKGDLRNWMRVGIVHPMAYPQTLQGHGPVLESVAALCRDPYFESVEITHIADPRVREQVAGMLAASQMEIGYAAQPVILGGRLDLNASDRDDRERAIARLKEALDEAEALGATKFAVMSGPDPGPRERDEAIERFVESLAAICSDAERRGIAVCVEVFDREIDKKALIGSTRDAVRVAAALRPRFPDFGLMLDLSHLPLQGESSEDSLTLAGDFIEHIHIGNCVLDKDHPLYGDHHPPFGVPGGENDVAELARFLKVLMDIGYLREGGSRTVAFEVRPRDGESSDLVIANAKRTLQAAWRSL